MGRVRSPRQAALWGGTFIVLGVVLQLIAGGGAGIVLILGGVVWIGASFWQLARRK